MTRARAGAWPPTGISYRGLAHGLRSRGYRRARQNGSHEVWKKAKHATIVINGRGTGKEMHDRVLNSVRRALSVEPRPTR